MGLDNWPKDHLSLKALLRTKPREREKNQKPSSHSMSGNSIPPTPPSLPKKKKTTHYVSVLSENDPQLANSFGYLHKIYCIIVR